MEKTAADQRLVNHHGDLGTFVIRVQHRQNRSWQGRVTWLEEDKSLNFRSTWELMKLMEDAVDLVDDCQEDELKWFPEGPKP